MLKPFFSGVLKIDEETGVQSVVEAFNLGINFFDTSPYYGNKKSETVSSDLRKHAGGRCAGWLKSCALASSQGLVQELNL